MKCTAVNYCTFCENGYYLDYDNSKCVEKCLSSAGVY